MKTVRVLHRRVSLYAWNSYAYRCTEYACSFSSFAVIHISPARVLADEVQRKLNSTKTFSNEVSQSTFGSTPEIQNAKYSSNMELQVKPEFVKTDGELRKFVSSKEENGASNASADKLMHGCDSVPENVNDDCIWEEAASRMVMYGIPSAYVRKMVEKSRNLRACDLQVDIVLRCLECLHMSMEQIGHIVSQQPTILATRKSRFAEKVKFFKSIGIGRADMGKILSVTHMAITSPVRKLERHVDFWQKYLEDVQSMSVEVLITKNPRLLTYSIENSVKPKITYLEKVGFDKIMLCKHISVLGCSMESIKSKVSLLQSFGLSTRHRLSRGFAALHNISNAALLERFNNLTRLGLDESKIQRILFHSPRVLSLREEYIQQKVEYAVKMLNVQLDELVNTYSFWTCSLQKRIRHRNEVKNKMKKKGLLKRDYTLSQLLRMKDAEFRKKLADKL